MIDPQNSGHCYQFVMNIAPSSPQNKPCEEPPITVIASLADIAHGYTKRKYVFKIVTALGSEFLMQVILGCSLT